MQLDGYSSWELSFLVRLSRLSFIVLYFKPEGFIMVRMFVIVAIIVNLILICIVLLFNLSLNYIKIFNCTIGISAFLIAMGSINLVDDYEIAGLSAIFWGIMAIVTMIRATYLKTDDQS